MRNIKKIAAVIAVVTITLSSLTFKVIHDKEVKEVVALGYTQEVARKKVTLYNFYKDPSKKIANHLNASTIALGNNLLELGYSNEESPYFFLEEDKIWFKDKKTLTHTPVLDFNELSSLELYNLLETELTNLKIELNNQIASYTKLFDSNKINYTLNTDSNLKVQVIILEDVYSKQLESIKKDLVKYNSKAKENTLKNDNIETEYSNYTKEVANSKKAYEKAIADEKAKQKALKEQKALEQQYIANNNNYSNNESYYQKPSYQSPNVSNGANNNYVAPTQPKQEDPYACYLNNTCSDETYKAGNPNYGGTVDVIR